MKALICSLAVIISFILAYYKESNSRYALESSKLLYDIAEKIKENKICAFSPITNIISEALGISEDADISDLLEKLKNQTQNAFCASEIYEKLLEIPSAILSNIDEKCDELVKITRESYEKAVEEYSKCRKTVFYVYPGITAIIAIIFI